MGTGAAHSSRPFIGKSDGVAGRSVRPSANPFSHFVAKVHFSVIKPDAQWQKHNAQRSATSASRQPVTPPLG